MIFKPLFVWDNVWANFWRSIVVAWILSQNHGFKDGIKLFLVIDDFFRFEKSAQILSFNDLLLQRIQVTHPPVLYNFK